MTRNKLEAYRRLYNRLDAWGFDADEADALCRIERTLHRWAELECNGEVETDDETGFAFTVWDNGQKMCRYRTANREAGALRRLAKLMARHPEFRAYHQGDPRGCALYIIDTRTVDMSPNDHDFAGWLDRNYTSGLAVCV